MAIPFLDNTDHNLNQLLNALLHVLATDPSPTAAQVWWNSTSKRFKGYDGTTIQTFAQLTDSLDKLAAAAANYSMGGNKITNLGTPTASTDAASKGYVDLAIQGLNPKDACQWATTAALAAGSYSAGVFTETSNGALSIDGGSPAVGDRILVKNQATASQNGIYVVTATGSGSAVFVLTRASDANTSADITDGLYTFVTGGTANANTGWLLTTANPITLDTTSLAFVQFNAAGGVVAGSGINVAGTTISVLTDGVTVKVISGNLSVVSDGTAGNELVSQGSTSAAAAWTKRGFAEQIGDGSTLVYPVTHGLGSENVEVQVWETGGGLRKVTPSVAIIDANSVSVGFSVAPSSDQYNVVVRRAF